MKIKLFNIPILILMVVGLLTNCSEDDTLKVYMPAAKAVVNSSFDVADTIVYTATIVAADYPTASLSSKSDVAVTFKVDPDKVATYNQSTGSNYMLLPSDNFTFDQTGTISKGDNSTAPLKLIIKNGDALDAFSSYLLPITIDKVNGGTMGESQQTTYFILTRSPPLEKLPHFDRTSWTIAAKDTEEPGEGNGNGLAIDAIDGNWGSYWHTKWAGSEPPPPHYITIDLGAETVIHGISIVDRDLKDWAHGQPKSIKVSLSDDGVTFTDDGSFDSLPMGTDPKQQELRYFLPTFKSARYLKITVNSTWGDTKSNSIAEIYAL